MNRRMPFAAICMGCAVAILVVTASSGPVRVWLAPEQIRTPSNGESSPAPPGSQSPAASDRIAVPSWVLTLLPILGLLLVVVVVIAVASVRAAPMFPHFGWRRLRSWLRLPMTPLPEVIERELNVDVEAALAALSEGDPRNAIIACWIQLERDTANVGLQRMVAETPAEYVERVVVASSVDPAPIKELAALYREARFSRHHLGDDHRTRALDALHRVASALKGKHKVST